MNLWFVRRARAAWWLGLALVLAGFAFVASFVCDVLLPLADMAPLPHLFPDVQVAWLPQSFPDGLVLAALGAALMALGAFLARWQLPILHAAKRRAEDAARRIELYRNESRIEPFVGPGAGASE